MTDSSEKDVSPGLCWHDGGVRWPHMPAGTTVRCELRAGHLGAHEAASMGGTAVWPTAESVAPVAPIILTRYRVKVHASNRNSDYGVPVEVYASSRQEAVDRAIDVGWAGQRRDARVTVLDIKQEHHIPPAANAGEAR